MRTHYGLNVTPWTTRASVHWVLFFIVIFKENKNSHITMEFVVKQKKDSKRPSEGSEHEWTVEECENYVRVNESLPPKERRQPLHEIFKGSTIIVKEETFVAVFVIVEN